MFCYPNYVSDVTPLISLPTEHAANFPNPFGSSSKDWQFGVSPTNLMECTISTFPISPFTANVTIGDNTATWITLHIAVTQNRHFYSEDLCRVVWKEDQGM
jgi:hypothetical protein